MESIIAFATVISVITIALTQLVKQGGVPKNVVPLIAIGIGIVLGGITNCLFLKLLPNYQLVVVCFFGLISGLMATGIWETVRTRTGSTKDKNNKIGGGRA